MSKNYIVISILSVILIFLSFSELTLAFLPQAHGDAWFTFTYQPDISKLPKGFSVVSSSITNTNDLPLYIVSKNEENTVYENSEIPNKYKPMYKLTKNTLFYYTKFDPQLNYGYDISKSGWYPEQTNSLPFSQIYQYFSGEIYVPHEDNRPRNPPIPETTEFNVVFFYNNKEIIMPVKIEYALNDKYDINAKEKMGQEQTKYLNSKKQSYAKSLYPVLLIFLPLIIYVFYKKKTLFKSVIIGCSVYLIACILLLLNMFGVVKINSYMEIAHMPALYLLSLLPNSFSGSLPQWLIILLTIVINFILYGLAGYLIGFVLKKIMHKNKVENNY